MNLYCIIYFPDDYNSFFINCFIILPFRISFLSVYKWDIQHILSYNNIIIIIYTVLIVFIIGLPFIYIKIIYYYIKYWDLSIVWNNLSVYDNLKIIVVDGTIIRNMRKSSKISLQYTEESKQKIENLFKVSKGLVKSGQGMHAAVIHEGQGILYTSKEQEFDKNSKISEYGESKSYAQKFDHDIKITDMMNIKNQILRDLIYTRGYIDLVSSKIYINENKERFVVTNTSNGKQIYTKIDDNDIKKSKLFIEKMGGKEELYNFIESGNFTYMYCKLINSGNRFLFEMSNASVKDRASIIAKYNSTHISLKHIINSDILYYKDAEPIHKLLDALSTLE